MKGYKNPLKRDLKKKSVKIFVTKKPFYCGRLEMSMVT